jgi:hypothetical protein
MPGGGGWVSTVPINHQPSIAMDKRGDDFRGNPLWVSASLNGKKAIIRDDRGYFYELDITVNKVENVQNTSTDSTERYDISAQIQRKDNPLVIGDSENFNSDAWIIKDDVPVAFNMAQGQYETTSLSYVEVGSFNGPIHTAMRGRNTDKWLMLARSRIPDISNHMPASIQAWSPVSVDFCAISTLPMTQV